MDIAIILIIGLVFLFFLALIIGLIIYFVTRKSSNNTNLTNLNKPNGDPINPTTQTCTCLVRSGIGLPISEPNTPVNKCISDGIVFRACQTGTTK